MTEIKAGLLDGRRREEGFFSFPLFPGIYFQERKDKMEDKTYERILEGFLLMCQEDEVLLERRRQLMIIEKEG